MIKPALAARVLIVTLLSACAGFVMSQAASAGRSNLWGGSPAVLSTQEQPSPLTTSPLRETQAIPRVATLATPPATTPLGRAYLFRGVAGLLFSRGMDRLAFEINRTGIAASVDDFLICRSIARKAIDDYHAAPAPITIIGHSAGGSCALAFAEMLQDKNIPVSLLVTIDPTRYDPIWVAHNVPHNVERYVNLYMSKGMLGGGDVLPGPGFQGHYASFDLSHHDEIIHINVDKITTVHQQLVAKILQLAVTPAGAEGEAVPIRIDVPAGAPIELWDSGMPVPARAGDTLAALAIAYHVPLWSLTQINPLPNSEPLQAGERIVVPRHLVPLTSPASDGAVRQAPALR
jgi:hypothetical protein